METHCAIKDGDEISSDVSTGSQIPAAANVGSLKLSTPAPPPRLCPPPPPPPPLPFIPNKTESQAGSISKPKKLNVRPITWQGLKDTSNDCLWAQYGLVKVEFDENDLVKYFGPVVTTNRSSSVSASKKFVRILDSRKARNLEISTKSMKLTVSQISDAILNLDTSIFTGNSEGLIVSLMSNWPSKEEEKKLKHYSGSISELGPAEQLWHPLLRIDHLEMKLHTLQVKWHLAERAQLLKNKMRFLTDVCHKVQECQDLSIVLSFVLAIGNKLNEGTQRANLKGITMEDLLVAGRARGFMQYLAKVISEQQPNVLRLWENFFSNGLGPLLEAKKSDRKGIENMMWEIEEGKKVVEHELLYLEKKVIDFESKLQRLERLQMQSEDSKRCHRHPPGFGDETSTAIEGDADEGIYGMKDPAVRAAIRRNSDLDSAIEELLDEEVGSGTWNKEERRRKFKEKLARLFSFRWLRFHGRSRSRTFHLPKEQLKTGLCHDGTGDAFSTRSSNSTALSSGVDEEDSLHLQQQLAMSQQCADTERVEQEKALEVFHKWVADEEQRAKELEEWKARRERIAVVDVFLNMEVNPCLDDLHAERALLDESTISLQSHFGLGATAISCNEIFGILYEFILLLKKAHLSNLQKKTKALSGSGLEDKVRPKPSHSCSENQVDLSTLRTLSMPRVSSTLLNNSPILVSTSSSSSGSMFDAPFDLEERESSD